MSLLLAPYNDSMRLGMGFNSYTQTMCIDNAVEVTNEDNNKVENPSQVVTYSSKFVERLSDIVSTMNISYSAAIKKGTIELSGNGNSIDEDKIKASDINLIVSVQVINQTTTLKDSAKFQAMNGVNAGSHEFNNAFGDCYISGFIEGGDFKSIISMRCLDRSNKSSVIRELKKMTQSNGEANEFTMDSYSLSNSPSGSTSNALEETETTISVNWMGGGQIKDPKTAWNIDSVYEVAAAFPSFVAQTPQKTWAILTKYKANRSFNQWAVDQALRPLEYDAVISYTAELFNNFMEYKQLVKKVQDIISNGSQYTARNKLKSIPIHIGTLVAVRSALRNEMSKIVSVVNVLSRKPELLAQANGFDVVSKNSLVREIVNDAIGSSPDTKLICYTETPAQGSEVSTSSNISKGGQNISGSDSDQLKDVADQEPLSGSIQPQLGAFQGSKVDLSALIAPEVWADLLPIRTGSLPLDQEGIGATVAAASLIPPPPKDDALTFLASKSLNSLKIISAVCGIQDVTETLQNRVKDEAMLTIPVNEIDKLVQSAAYEKMPIGYIKTLVFIYQYGNGPMRVCASQFDKDSIDSIVITSQSVHGGEVKARPWTEETWSIVTCVIGNKVYNDDRHLKDIEDEIRRNYNNSKYGAHHMFFNRMNWDGYADCRTCIIFFKSSQNGPIRAAAALPERECLLTDQVQLAEMIIEVPKGAKPRTWNEAVSSSFSTRV